MARCISMFLEEAAEITVNGLLLRADSLLKSEIKGVGMQKTPRTFTRADGE